MNQKMMEPEFFHVCAMFYQQIQVCDSSRLWVCKLLQSVNFRGFEVQLHFENKREVGREKSREICKMDKIIWANINIFERR
jgi:hypothetical protein